MKNYFTNEEVSVQNSLVEKGYFIFNIKENILINSIRKKTLLHIKKWFKSEKLKVPSKIDILDNIHKFVSIKNLNSLRLYVFNKLNEDKKFHENYFFIGKKYIDILCGNEVSMQKKINLSIQLPNDDSSLLPVHSDVWQGDSPYELVLWVPLVNCSKTKSMYILPKKINQKYQQKLLKYNSSSKIFNEIKNKVKWLDIKYGQGLIFTQNIMHGNVVNTEKTTRWSFNCRFKSLLSPYSGKTIGDFFTPITIRAATRLGMNYEEPKKK